MTTQPQTDRITAHEIRELFADLHAEIEELRTEIEGMRTGLQQAASQPARAENETMQAVKLVRTKSKGKWYYKLQGGRYMKNGVTIWEEALDLLDLKPEAIAWDEKDEYKLPSPINVTMQIKTYTDPETGEIKQTPQKVTGKV